MIEPPDAEEPIDATGVDEDSLDFVLRDYHRRRRSGATDSVIDVLTRDVGALPSVLLWEPDDESDPVVQPAADDELVWRRYQVHGEIARGGVGVIHKGRDTDLGRDIAIKSLLDRHVGNPNMVHRFVEEAQIGGQLQHPGILPVYEMGLREDQRPYFTMKLVKGQTLAALLAERTEPAEDRRRFLSAFEQVCQTMAYAHSRAVIHRDLKPANIMIGSFGEVLVMDWGLAKVLGRGGVADERRTKRSGSPTQVETIRDEGSGAKSVTGSVMGTPAYMPPEQARGEVEDLDQRSDVFSLGAILLEILTGRPPYVGESSKQVRDAAARADLSAALDGLRDAGLDAELVAIVQACLTPEKKARPRDAAAVAERIGDYLSSVERRARSAEVAAAEARVEATAAIRQRKLARGLAVSAALIAVLVCVGAIAWYGIASQRQTEREARHTTFGELLADAERLYARAEALATPQPEPWARARDAARRAVTLDSEDLPATVRARATALLEKASRGLDAATAATRRQRENAELLRALSSCHHRGPHVTAPLLRDHVERELQRVGIDMFGSDYDAILAAVRGRGIDARLAAGLDAWAHLYQRSHTPERNPVVTRPVTEPSRTNRAERLYRIASDLDPDPWRVRLRRSLLTSGPAELVDMLRDPLLAKQGPGTVALLVDLYEHEGRACADPRAPELPNSVRILREALERHPTDYRLNLLMSHLLGLHQKPPRLQEALAHARTAAAARPDDATAWSVLGQIHTAIDGHPHGLMAHARAVDLDPQSGHLRLDYAYALRRAGRLTEALDEYAASLRFFPNASNPFFASRLIRAALGQSAADRITVGRAELESHSDKAMGHYFLAEDYYFAGDVPQAIEHIERAIRIAPDRFFQQFFYGIYLMVQARYDDARRAFREAGRLNRNPRFAEKWVRDTGRLREIARTLDDAIANERFGESPGDQLLFAMACVYARRFDIAADLFLAIDDRHPGLIEKNGYHNPAAVAVLRVKGERAADCRRRVLKWLRAAFEVQRRRFPANQSKDALTGPLVRMWVRPAFAVVREPQSLAALPESERLAWESFWRELRAFLHELTQR